MSSDVEKLIEALHDHDRRIIAIEVEMRGVHKEVKELRDAISKNTEAHMQLLAQVAEGNKAIGQLQTGQTILTWILGLGVGAITLLEIYAVLIR